MKGRIRPNFDSDSNGVPHEGADNQRRRQRTEGRPLAGGAQYVEFPAQFDAEVGLRPTPAVTHCNFNFL